jgi:hypothetical protein
VGRWLPLGDAVTAAINSADNNKAQDFFIVNMIDVLFCCPFFCGRLPFDGTTTQTKIA